jgi:hypothetical protein
MSPKQTDEGARLAELEATVRGLTQELVEANERIRTLEAALEDGAAPAGGRTDRPVLDGTQRNGESADADESGNTRQMGDDGLADEKADSDLDDIIVA